MRHYFTTSAPRPVPRLASVVAKPAGAALLIAAAGFLERGATGVRSTGARAVPLPTIAAPAQIEDVTAVRADTDHPPQRVHALPRSGANGAP